MSDSRHRHWWAPLDLVLALALVLDLELDLELDLQAHRQSRQSHQNHTAFQVTTQHKMLNMGVKAHHPGCLDFSCLVTPAKAGPVTPHLTILYTIKRSTRPFPFSSDLTVSSFPDLHFMKLPVTAGFSRNRG